MTLRIVGWERWQGAAVKELKRKRASGSKRPLRMAYLSVASELYDDPDLVAEQGSFERFAAAVVGRNADGLWLRVLQFVGLRDPQGGTLLGLTRETLGPNGLTRPWGKVGASEGAVIWDALLASGLAAEVGKAARIPRKPRGISAETARKPRGIDLDLDLKGRESTAVDSDVAVRHVSQPAPSPPEAQSTAVGFAAGNRGTATAPSKEAACACRDGLLEDGSYCRACAAGTRRLALYRDLRQAERDTESKADDARGRVPTMLESDLSKNGRWEAERARQLRALREEPA